MDDVISKLTAAQALKIVERLGRKGGFGKPSSPKR
jgi:hypothetical protein